MTGSPRGGRLRAAVIASAAARGRLASGTILTAKLDSFGGRIGDLLNGWRLAQALGTRFAFYWPLRDVPGILPADQVFAPEFLAEHLVESVDLSRHRPVTAISLRDVRTLQRGGTVLLATKNRIAGLGRFQVAGDGFPIPGLMSMAEAFARLPFRREFRDVRDWASTVPEFDVAIHARRGDVFSGDFRLGGHAAEKAVPLPLLRRLLADLPADARILLIGEDPERLVPLVAADRTVILPDSFTPPGAGLPGVDVLRDFCLLTRARRIVAAKSVFALVPARIAGIEPTPPEELLPRSEIVDLLLAYIRDAGSGPDLEVALACEHLRVCHPEVAARHGDELVAIAHAADPANPVYVLRLAAMALRAGDRDGAAARLAGGVDRGMSELLLRLLRNDLDISRGVALASIWGGYLTSEDLTTLRAAAPELGWCAFVSALEHAATGAFDAARAELEGTSTPPDHPAVRGLRDLLADPPARVPSRRGGSLIRPSVEEGVL